MSQRSWKLDRRTWLRGAGVACALPYLEAMSWATPLAAKATSAGTKPRKRMCFLYFPNGVSLPLALGQRNNKADPTQTDWNWFPEGQGRECKFTKVLEPFEPVRDELTVLGGFSHPKSRKLLGHLAGDTWLTGGDLRGSQYLNSISADQVAARHLGQFTRYPSLTFSTDGGIGYKSRIATLSFADGGRPIPAEHSQRAIFERYFSPNGGGTTEQRRQGLARGKKIVDLVLEDANSVHRQLGKRDREKLDEYLTSLSDVEGQIERNEAWLDVPMTEVDASNLDFEVAANVDPQGYIRTMMDLMVLAFQTDVTRVITYMIAREDGMGFGENFPRLALGFKNGHHGISHDKTTGHWVEWGSYDRWLASQAAYFVDRLRSVEDEHGPVLQNTLVLYGSACSSTHNARNYPLVLAGGQQMGVEHQGYHQMPEETPMSNLLLTLLNLAGVEVKQFSDSDADVRDLLVPA